MHDSTSTLAAFLDATAAKQPIPGGGAVAALAGALSAAIGEMVLNYSVGKKDLQQFLGELQPALAELHRARAVLLELMVEDQSAFEVFSAIKKLPADSAERAHKLPAAVLVCIRGPQAMGATAVGILKVCDRIVNYVNPWLLSDLAVCADLAMATVRCASYNVRVNLGELTDLEERKRFESATNQMVSHAVEIVQRVVPRIWERHAKT